MQAALVDKDTMKRAVKEVWIRSLTEISPDILAGLEAARDRELWDIDRREDLLPAAGKDITE